MADDVVPVIQAVERSGAMSTLNLFLTISLAWEHEFRVSRLEVSPREV